MFIKKKDFSRAILLLFLATLVVSCNQKKGEQEEEQIEVTHLYEYGICIDSLDVNYYSIKNGDYLSSILLNLGFSAAKSYEISQTLTPILHPSRLRAGNKYTTLTTQDSIATVNYIIFEKSMTDYAIVDLTSDSIKAHDFVKPTLLKCEYAEGIITSSLWNALIEAGASPLLTLKLSDVFAWQIDFFGIQKGDAFRVMYNAAYIDDTIFIDIPSIEGAIFTHHNKEFKAFWFEQDSIWEHFDEQGNSLRKAFLKAPMDFFRITSKFSNSRFHPVLKRYRAHHGVDYAAPVGTPVKTIGDGVVIEKGFQSGGAGNYMKVKHNATYTTTYMHLSRFAKGIQKGSRVTQGQIIAYVGSSGLSTGPHLDFRVHKNGTPIDPLKMEAPPSLPVKPELIDSFMLVQQRIMLEMDSLRSLLKNPNEN